MKTVKVSVVRLLSALKSNREKHIAEYNEAVKGYREQCIAKMKENLAKAEAGGDILVSLAGCYKPESHEKDYDHAISMCEWTTSPEVELSASEFQQYVNDEWTWQQSFKTVNAMYLSK